jgi:hypothetical protein
MLHRPWSILLVVVFWCVTTGWLVVEKILPSLAPGSPPGYQALYVSGNKLAPVAWTVSWNDLPLGFALSEAVRTEEGGMEVDSLLHFDRLPIDEMLPSWTKLLLRPAVPPGTALVLDARSRMEIDADGDLRAFDSTMDLPGTGERVTLEGTVDDGEVHVSIRARDMRYTTVRHLPAQLTIGNELSPQATIPGLFRNRRWTVPIYSPLRPGHAPIEILHAHVVGDELMAWNDELVRVHVVHYADDPAAHREPRCRLWVDERGRVLRQESAMLGSRLSFLRRGDDDAARLVAEHPWREQERPDGRRHTSAGGEP